MSAVIEKKKLTKAVAKKVLTVVDKGLCKGVGKPIPGQMCVEAAVCFALGEKHGDEPSCVGAAVRAYKINLNDANWSSDAARAKGMRRVALAQLGSDEISQIEFAKLVTIDIVRQILPEILRTAAAKHPDEQHKASLNEKADSCEKAESLEQARAASDAARDASDAARAASAARAARAAASDAARAASYAASDASDAASYAARAASYAASDAILTKAATIAVNTLIKLGAKGCQWLGLCE